MKTLLIPFLFFTLFAGAQPNKTGVDSVTLYNNVLKNYSKGVATVRGWIPNYFLSHDSDRNVALTTTNSIIGMNNFIGLNNGNVVGHENFSYARNIIIQNVNGTFSAGADHTFHKGSDYSATVNGTLGDGNDVGGYASFTTGFGNWDFNDHGFVAGQNNTHGSLNRSTIISNQYQGGALIGDNLKSQGNYIYSIGTNFSTTETGFFVGYGRQMFAVLPSGKIVLNGVAYTMPAANEARLPGSVLTNDGSDQLHWAIPATSITTIQAPIPPEQVQRKIFQAFTPDGRLLYLVEVKQIK